MAPLAWFRGMPHKCVHLAHWIYPGRIEGGCKFDRVQRHTVGNRTQYYFPDVPHGNQPQWQRRAGSRVSNGCLPSADARPVFSRTAHDRGQTSFLASRLATKRFNGCESA